MDYFKNKQNQKFSKTLRLFLPLLLLLLACQSAPTSNSSGFDNAAHYSKYEYNIPMRDGVKLYTAVYVPMDTSQQYPFLMKRSPYSSGPYGPDKFPGGLGPVGNSRFAEEGYIFVYQDVRGRFMSEGTFVNMTPHVADKKSPQDIDESSDMYDTVDWLLKNVPHNNGRVGLWGISYPGFYVAASIIDSHPAIKAASPQAAIGDWFIGDDFHHKGAFYLQDAFNFFSFLRARPRIRPIHGVNAGGLMVKMPTRFSSTSAHYPMPTKTISTMSWHSGIPSWNTAITTNSGSAVTSSHI